MPHSIIKFKNLAVRNKTLRNINFDKSRPMG